MYKNCLIMVLATLSLVEGQGCGLEGISGTVLTLPVLEATPGDTPIGQYRMVNVTSTAAVFHDFGQYTGAVRNFATRDYRVVTTAEFSNFMSTEREREIRRPSYFYCQDGTRVLYTFVISVIDENNQKPITETPFDIYIDFPLGPQTGEYTLFSTEIVVTDADLNFENADLAISIIEDTTEACDCIEPKITPLWGFDVRNPLFSYKVDLRVKDTIGAVTRRLAIHSTDGVHDSYKFVDLHVQYTTPVGPIHDCGYVGYDPSNTIRSGPLDPALPPGTKIWGGQLWNVESTVTSNFPTPLYLAARKNESDYYALETGSTYPNLLGNTVNIVSRMIILTCNGGEKVTYYFSFEIKR